MNAKNVTTESPFTTNAYHSTEGTVFTNLSDAIVVDRSTVAPTPAKVYESGEELTLANQDDYLEDDEDENEDLVDDDAINEEDDTNKDLLTGEGTNI